MRQVRWASWTMAVAAVLLAGAPHAAKADVTSDKAAAIVVWPIVNVAGPFGDDTLIQLSNTGTTPVEAHCFYLNANSHCSNTGEVCSIGAQCCGGGGCGFCLPAWQETDFRIFLTPRQPIAWLASMGYTSCTQSQTPGEDRCIAIDGTSRKGVPGPDGLPTSNAGTRILPVPETPFIGELKCIVVDRSSGDPIKDPSANVLKGEAIIETATNKLDVGKYNAIGIRALQAPNIGPRPNVLTLSNDVGEYEGCPNVLVLNHFFDNAWDPALDNGTSIFTWPVFVPCTEDFLQQQPGTSIAQYLVFNEFEQRFSTSNTIQCFRASGLSFIDTTQPQNSIFNVGISGTLVGQTRVSPIGSGLLAVALEFHGQGPDGTTVRRVGQQADANVHYQGQRATPDVITLP